MFVRGENTIFALINTTTIGGSTACFLGTPCEVTADGTELHPNTSYATPVQGVGTCFDADGRFDLAQEGCPLDDGRQLTIEGYPPQAVQPVITRPDGTQVEANWDTILVGSLPYYRYKTGPVGQVDCREETGYSDVIALADQDRIDELLPTEEGSYYLCVVAGENEQVDESWQPLAFVTVGRAEIDTTPPTVAPIISVIEAEGDYLIDFIFSIPELADYRFKVGPVDTTDCTVTDDYQRYRRFPTSVSADQLPVKVCAIGFDNADNASPPAERIVDVDL